MENQRKIKTLNSTHNITNRFSVVCEGLQPASTFRVTLLEKEHNPLRYIHLNMEQL